MEKNTQKLQHGFYKNWNPYKGKAEKQMFVLLIWEKCRKYFYNFLKIHMSQASAEWKILESLQRA